MFGNFLFIKADKPYPKDIKSLTSLRFFAATMIVIFHYLLEFPFFKIGEGFLGRFYLAVDFFFILSGFILTHSYLGGIKSGTFSVYNFYIKRFARIYPVHLFTLLISGISTLLTIAVFHVIYDSGDSVSCFVKSVFLLQAWGVSTDLCFNDPSWSISAEWFAYLLFPAIVPFFLGIKWYRALPLCIFAFLGLCYLAYLYFPTPLTQLTYFGFARIVPEFSLGVALYLFGLKYSLKKPTYIKTVLLLTVIVLFMYFNLPDAFIVLLYGGLIFMAAEQSRQGLASYMEGRKLVYWGEASYSLYMVHYVIWEALPIPVLMRANDGSKNFDAIFMFSWVLALILSFVVAHYVYKYIERPSRTWICRHFLK